MYLKDGEWKWVDNLDSEMDVNFYFDKKCSRKLKAVKYVQQRFILSVLLPPGSFNEAINNSL